MDDRHKPQACSRDGCWPLDILSLKAIKWDEPSFVKTALMTACAGGNGESHAPGIGRSN